MVEISIVVAFAAGIVSFLSPCMLPIIVENPGLRAFTFTFG